MDSYSNHGKVDLAVEPPEDQNWAEWFEARLKDCEPIPRFVCDGKTVWENSEPAARHQAAVEGESAHRATGLDVRRRPRQSPMSKFDRFAIVP